MARRLKSFVIGCALALAGIVTAQSLLPYFGPVDGLLVGEAGNPLTTEATGEDVAATFTGTCNSSTFLRGDGACAAAGSGSVTSVQAAGTGIFAFTGGPVTGDGTLTLTQTGTSGGVPYFSAGGTLSSSAALASGGVVIGGGAGTTPATDAGLTYNAGADDLSVASQVLHGDGTEADPAVTFTSDTNLGLYRVGADSLGISVGAGGTVLTASAAAGLSTGTGFPVAINGTLNANGALNVDPAGGTDELTVADGVVNVNATLNVDVAGGTDEINVTTGLVTIPGALTVSGTCTGCGTSQSTATFTVTGVGFSSPPSESWRYVLNGNTATLRWPANSGLAGTSTDTGFTSNVGDIPSAIRPAATVSYCGSAATDNSVTTGVAGFSISTAGTITFTRTVTGACSSSTWTAAGVKGFSGTGTSANTFTYTLN